MHPLFLLNRSGELEPLDSSALEDLRGRISGQLVDAGDPGYDAVCTIWNGMIRRRPGLFIRCRSEEDVVAAMDFVRHRDLAFSVRSGGHNIAGTSLCDQGVVIDLSLMKAVAVDPARRRVIVDAGCTLGDVDRATQPHGLAVPAGIVSETGIAGLTMGGGFGWLTRQHGYTSDNLLSARLVLPDGSLVEASEHEHPELFWGIRGGGGNFGIVTRFEFLAHPVGPEVMAGMLVWPISQAPDVMRFYRAFADSLPDEACALMVLRPAPPAPFLPADVHGKPVIAIAAMHAGSVEDGEHVLAPIRRVGKPLGGSIAAKPFLAHQAMLDAGQPKGRHYYWKSEYLAGLSEDSDRIMVEYASCIESPHSAILIFQLGGAMARIPEDASAAGHRTAGFVVNIAASWEDPAESARHTAWVRDGWEAIRPHSMGTYVNFLTEDDGSDRVRAAYGGNYERLAALKLRYDPENLLRVNQNVVPRNAVAAQGAQR